jgi:WD40 repeat protein
MSQTERRQRLAYYGCLLLSLVVLFGACGGSVTQTALTPTSVHRATPPPGKQPLQVYHIQNLNTQDSRTLAFSSSGRFLATCTTDNKVEVWNVMTGQLLHSFSYPFSSTDSPTLASLNAAAFSPDKQFLAVGAQDQTIRIWDMKSGKIVSSITDAQSGGILSLAYSADGRLLADGSQNGEIAVWNVATSLLQQRLIGQTQAVYTVVFSPKSNILASGCEDMTARIWDVASGRTLHILTGHTGPVDAMSFSPDGQTLVSGSQDGIRIWNVSNGDFERAIVGDGTFANVVSFSPNGQFLVSGTQVAHVQFWKWPADTLAQSFLAPGSDVTTLAFLSSGLLATLARDGTLSLWRI